LHTNSDYKTTAKKPDIPTWNTQCRK
jgi:hypothetical protein